MTVTHFPPTHLADEHGLLAVGGDVEVDSLLLAYRSGIFPWPLQPDVLTWFAPPTRAILEVERFVVSRSMKRFLKRQNYSLYINKDFPAVIEACQKSPHRGEQSGTWITDDLVNGYIDLHQAGYAHSIECYEGSELVGGLYGVGLGAMFAGESMFHERDNTSKLCLCFLIEWLRRAGVPWLDCQVLTSLTERFGAHEVAREEFEELLREQVIQSSVKLFPKETVQVGVWRGERI